MSNAKERYQANRARVFEIYGINPNDPNYSCHHIVFRSDFTEANHFPKGYCDSKANLFPLPIKEHEELHRKVDSQEENRSGILYQAAPRRKPKKKRQLSFEERLLRGLEN